ncbi:MAG: TolC family protein, partial [Dokdonella sp.]
MLSAVLLGACAVGPDYRQPPPVDSGSGWAEAPDAVATHVDFSAWWTALGDPELERLVNTALADNVDLRLAHARISETRALRDRAAGGYVPAVGTGGTVTRRRQSENGPLPIASIPGMQRDQTI